MKKKFDYTKSTFYVSLIILVVVLAMSYPYVSSAAQFIAGETIPGPGVCGNGIIEMGEACDSDTVDCSVLGNYESGNDATCLADCLGYDLSDCFEIVLDQESWFYAQSAMHGMPIAQTFTPDITGNLSSVDVYVANGICPVTTTPKAYMQIRDTIVSGGNTNGWPGNTILASKIFDLPEDTNFDTVNVDFSEFELVLDTGTKYAVVITCGSWTYSYILSLDYGENYLDGAGYTYFNGIWTNRGDFRFKTYMIVEANTPPIAIMNIALPVTGEDPIVDDIITFDGSNSYDIDGTIDMYVWDFGDGTVAAGTLPTVTNSYSDAGTYDVLMSVIDNEGASGIDTETITVSLPSIVKEDDITPIEGEITPIEKIITNMDPIAIIYTNTTTPSLGETVLLDGSNSYDFDGDIVSWDWTIELQIATIEDRIIPPIELPIGIELAAPGEQIIPPPIEGDIIEHVFSTSGTYIVTLEVTDNEDATDDYSIVIVAGELVYPIEGVTPIEAIQPIQSITEKETIGTGATGTGSGVGIPDSTRGSQLPLPDPGMLENETAIPPGGLAENETLVEGPELEEEKWGYLLGVITLIVLGVGGFYFLRKEKKLKFNNKKTL